jgi:hypothetical protein
MPPVLYHLDRAEQALIGHRTLRGVLIHNFARRSHSYRLKNSKVAKDTGVIESSGYDLASAPIGPCAGRKTPRS